ncbi:hypothetical protein AVEN_270853-1 [Araneus ventricosus]|uniref:Uncharacterized protein n=1 Tax=Araneus ventricosus TaxID=182803 RepID=A0A4Y2L3M4_ARAVE|nr:hypothetical protein AVEN_270853-1 [Araneus ventricosus]
MMRTRLEPASSPNFHTTPARKYLALIDLMCTKFTYMMNLVESGIESKTVTRQQWHLLPRWDMKHDRIYHPEHSNSFSP